MKRARDYDTEDEPDAKRSAETWEQALSGRGGSQTSFLGQLLAWKFDSKPMALRDAFGTKVAAVIEAEIRLLVGDAEYETAEAKEATFTGHPSRRNPRPVTELKNLWDQKEVEQRKKQENETRKRSLEQKVAQDVMEKNALNLEFLCVGQGDCTFIKTPGERTILIDSGTTGGLDVYGANTRNSNAAVVSRLAALVGAKGELDVLILTHPDKDHYNFIPVLGFSTISRVYHSNKLDQYTLGMKAGGLDDGEGALATSAYLGGFSDCLINEVELQSLRKIAFLNGTPAKFREQSVTKKATQTEWLDEYGALVILHEPNACTVRILASEVGFTGTNYGDGHARNSGSVVVLIEAFNKRILICGDATKETETFLLKKYGKNLLKDPLDLLRCSHHGSDEACNIPDFIAHTQPKEVVVSAAKEHRAHGLPNLTVIERCWKEVSDDAKSKHNIWYWYKAAKGDITHDNLYDNKLSLFTKAEQEKFEVKRLWVTGSHGPIVRSFKAGA